MALTATVKGIRADSRLCADAPSGSTSKLLGSASKAARASTNIIDSFLHASKHTHRECMRNASKSASSRKVRHAELAAVC